MVHREIFVSSSSFLATPPNLSPSPYDSLCSCPSVIFSLGSLLRLSALSPAPQTAPPLPLFSVSGPRSSVACPPVGKSDCRTSDSQLVALSSHRSTSSFVTCPPPESSPFHHTVCSINPPFVCLIIRWSVCPFIYLSTSPPPHQNTLHLYPRRLNPPSLLFTVPFLQSTSPFFQSSHPAYP